MKLAPHLRIHKMSHESQPERYMAMSRVLIAFNWEPAIHTMLLLSRGIST